MNFEDIVFDGHHELIDGDWVDGHPYIRCQSPLGMGDGSYRLHYDDARGVFWCESCCTSFEPYRPIGRDSGAWVTSSTGQLPGAGEVKIPVLDEKTGKIIKVVI
jgi:hypothetical protein